MKRGIALNSLRTDVLNSYISDVKAVNADHRQSPATTGRVHFDHQQLPRRRGGERSLRRRPTRFPTRCPRTSKCAAITFTSRSHGRVRYPRPPGFAAGHVNDRGGQPCRGTHYFKIVALMDTDTVTAVSAPSSEVSEPCPGGNWMRHLVSGCLAPIAIGSTAAPRAGGQSRFLETPSASTTFTYTGVSQKYRTPRHSAPRGR